MIFELSEDLADIPISADLLLISHRIAKKDPTIWGDASEAAHRLGWVDLPERSRSLLPQLDALAGRLREREIERIVLSGMGGSSLAPEVIAKTFHDSVSRSLTILDSTEPHFVSAIVDGDLSKTLFVISSKSGSTIETTSHLSLIEERLLHHGLDCSDHLVIITDPDSPLERLATERGWQFLHGQADVGGRFSALSAFGLTPAALIGIDPSLLLDDASEMVEQIHEPAVRMATYLAPHRYLYFADSKKRLPGLAEWIEQLIAESTGKSGRGLLPIALESGERFSSHSIVDLSTIVTAPLGAHFILWEWVTALLGYIYEVDPFDQPDVQATKTRTLEALSARVESSTPLELTEVEGIPEALEVVMRDREYLVICAFADPVRDHQLSNLRELLERRYRKPVAFGWGPRFLHSTGQFHKGGPKVGAFLSITVKSPQNLQIPGKDYGFAELIRAQAEGDKRALEESGGLVVNAHLNDSADVERLVLVVAAKFA